MTDRSKVGARTAKAARTPEAPRVRTLGRRVPKASEVLVHTLLEHIAKSGLTEGDRLAQESEMMEQYGVGRATVREALRILELIGLVSVRSGPGGGPTVRSSTPADLGRLIALFLYAEHVTPAELLLARSLIEPMLARDAAQQQDPEFLGRVRDLLERTRSVDVENDQEYVQVAREFHELTVSGTPNRVFSLIGLALMTMFMGNVAQPIHEVPNRREILREHEAVLKAILAAKPQLAENLMRKHMGELRQGVAARFPDAARGRIPWL